MTNEQAHTCAERVMNGLCSKDCPMFTPERCIDPEWSEKERAER
ncbi:MAG: hypothetical protein A4E53_01174 [Pelotomaculum sp. PtaB.Bin104]|nr:MAG: hypothetical protein A4E53_01174 [Pelotomaculum sp. PtaB.Bin104]